MCGIAGHCGPRTLPDAAIESCLGRMYHRGPDGAAVRQWRRDPDASISLLFTRLAIVDLDARANQPMQYGRKWLVFNGEIYNHHELRTQLEDAGHVFRTESDSEVLLHALDEWGCDALDRCEGMWAFALYNEDTRTLTLSRDRFGEKPLYLLRDGPDLYFGSEVAFLGDLRGRRPRVNVRQVARFLANGYKCLYKSNETFFEDVTELPGGTTLQIGPEGTRCQRYWTPRFVPDADMSFDEAVAGARERVIRAIGLRLRADVPLAFCLSGGVDSNSIIGVAKRIFKYDVHGFTLVNTDARYEEMDVINHAVAELGIRHTQVPVTPAEFLPRLRELVRAHDAPVVTINYYGHWLLQESLAAQGYRVSVSGTAADELFSGYYDHHLMYLHSIRDDAALLAESRDAWARHVLPLVRNRALRDWDRFIKAPDFRDHIYVDGPPLDGLLRSEARESFVETAFTDDLLRNRMLNEMFFEGVPVILHEDDLNAMYFSVENRSPFLDRALFEFCYTIPSRHLVRDGAAKAVLRAAMRGIVPDVVLDNRRKVGFNAPIYSFLNVHDPDVRSWLLSDGSIYDLVDRAGVDTLISKPRLDNHESKFLFYLVSSKLFLEEFAA